ncbi:MAG: insulinase family protein, partial [Planctomycetes bacterium]|nr:insulinase family protein [Planctomycetota bacterium]
MAGLTLLLAALFLATAPLRAQEDEAALALRVREYRLNNGMLALIVERHSTPTVSCMITLRAGSVNEREGATGLAHFLEHMMFKGTDTLGTLNYGREEPFLRRQDLIEERLHLEEARGKSADPVLIERYQRELAFLQRELAGLVVKDEVWSIYLKHGADGLNASTSTDTTWYYCSLPSNKLELWAWVESNRLAKPVFREFYTEREVVKEERRMRTDTDPDGKLGELLRSTAFTAHPYRWPVVGWMADLDRLTKPEMEEFFQAYYAPNNAVITIVGDVRTHDVMDLLDRYFAPIPMRTVPPPVESVEPPQQGERRATLQFEAGSRAMIGFHKGAFSSADQPALEVLATLLATGKSSRLYRDLVLERRLCSAVNAMAEPSAYPNLFLFTARPAPAHTIEEAEAAVLGHLETLKSTPVPAEELEQAKNRLEVQFLQGLQTNIGLARQLGYYEALGSWHHLETLPARRRAVTPVDLQRVARTVFADANRTVATLVRPEKGPPASGPIGAPAEPPPPAPEPPKAAPEGDETSAAPFLKSRHTDGCSRPPRASSLQPPARP